MKAGKESAFGMRLREAFGGASNAEIGRILDIGPSTVTDYMRGNSYPTADGLLRIAEITKCNLHWLLLGEGEKDLDPLRFLDPAQRNVVEKLADNRGVEVGPFLNELVTDGLVRLGAELFLQYRTIHPTELEQLQALFNALYQVEDNSSASRASSKRQAS